ncbi:MAG: right-handed parallel beta-helix repeat-containing protein [Planctomycetota bacterium]
MQRSYTRSARHTVPLILAISLLGLCPLSAVGAIIYVDDDAPNDPGPGDPAVSDPDEDGSAEHPFDAIQEALDAANDGDEIVVADGTYYGEGNGDLDFAGKAITLRSENGPDACTIDCYGRGFYFHSDETEASVLDGFTIQGGGATPHSPGGSAGGGILCRHSSPTIRNCDITECRVFVLYGGNAYGGGICCLDGSSPTINNCDITLNTLRVGDYTSGLGYGAGVYCEAGSPAITNCTIAENRIAYPGYSFGGGIACSNASPAITNCTIRLNVADGRDRDGCGGGIYCAGGAPTFTDCTITENSAAGAGGFGGGIYCESDGDAVLVNCTIGWNWVDCHYYGDYGGGGIYCAASSPTFIGCAIVGNEICEENNYGGGIACEFDGNLTIINSTITGNSAPAAGGGIYCYLSSPTIADCTIGGNVASSWQTGTGGGVYCEAADPIITACTITANSADFAGGGIFCETADPIITGCTINGNSANSAGGGIYAGYDSQPVIRDCTIDDNGSGFGSGICCEWYSSPTIDGCTIVRNGTGDGYYPRVGGGVCCRIESSPAIRNCLIAENAADLGGGIYAHFHSSPTIANCTLAHNAADNGTGGLYVSYGGSPEITNSVLWDNLGQIALDAFGYYPVQLTVSHCDIQGGQAGVFNDGCTLIWGDGNIDADPLFADPDNGDYHLTADSPCIDTGDPEFLPQPLEADIDGHARLWDGDDDETTTVDMGADEFGSFPYGDLNCDGLANAYDIDRLICAVSPNCDYEGLYPDCDRRLADCNGDGLVNAYDIDSFIDVLAGN